MRPTFSIIIPAHNEENYIRQTLHSIKQQTYQNFEIIVVTNGCTDRTEEIVRARKVKHVSLSKANVSAARNAGANKATGKILLFLDADTKLDKDSLRKIKKEFTLKYSVATTLVVPDEAKRRYKAAMFLKNLHNKTRIYEGCSGALICRKEDFEHVNGYDPAIIVKEHRKLTLKLKRLGKYKCIKTPVTTSMRRFNSWGMAKSAIYWIKQLGHDKFGDLSQSDYERIR